MCLVLPLAAASTSQLVEGRDGYNINEIITVIYKVKGFFGEFFLIQTMSKDKGCCAQHRL